MFASRNEILFVAQVLYDTRHGQKLRIPTLKKAQFVTEGIIESTFHFLFGIKREMKDPQV
jgi:hypothetical protein